MRTVDSDRAALGLWRGLTPVEKDEQIAGDLCRGEDGKFTACGVGSTGKAVPPQMKGSDLNYVGTKTGSVPGGRYRDAKTGREFIVKFYPDRSQAAMESIANSLYAVAGFRATSSQVVPDVDHQGVKKFGIANEVIQNLEVPETESAVYAARQDVAAGYGMDALLANWDVMGQTYDNIGFVQGKAVRLDNGGSMHFRAQGKPKLFPEDKVSELDTFLDSGMNPRTAKVYNSAFEENPKLKIQSMRKAGSLSDKAIESAVRSAHLTHIGYSSKVEDGYIDTLKKRRDIIAAKAEELASASAPAGTKPKGRGAILEEYRKFHVKLKEKVSKSREVLNTVRDEGYGPTPYRKLSAHQKSDLAKRVAVRLLSVDPDKKVGVATISGQTMTTTARSLIDNFSQGWSGSPHDRYAQWFRQVAAESYHRDLSAEHLHSHTPMWLKHVPEEVRDAALSVKAASEALFMETFGLKNRKATKEFHRGITGQQAEKIGMVAKSLPDAGKMKIEFNVLSSFSTDKDPASSFAGSYGVIVRCKVGAEHVWGYGGFGYSEELEAVLGRRRTYAIVQKENIIKKSVVIPMLFKQVGAPILIIDLPDEDMVPEEAPVIPGIPTFNIDEDPVNYLWTSSPQYRQAVARIKANAQ